MRLSIRRQPDSQAPSREKRPKYFVNRQEMVTIRCRTCGRTETFPVADLKGQQHTVRMHCTCNETFEVDLEFRQDYRKKTHIAASFRALTTPKTRARQCVIADHSNGGLLLAISDEVPIKEDDRLIVCYRPDPDYPHEVERIIRVRHYDRGQRIGGAFLDNHTMPLPHAYASSTNLH